MKSKYIFRIILCSIISILVITSCSGSDQNEVFEGLYDSDENESDLGGYEMLYKYGGDISQIGGGCLGYNPSTQLEDAAIQRIEELEKNMKCTITVIDDTDSYNNFILATTSGTYYCDAVWERSGTIRDMAKIGGVQGITSLTQIDYTDFVKWGSTRVLESLYYDDDLYGLLPSLWPEKADTHFGHTIVVNENLIARLGVDDPRDYVDSGNWTWNTFKSLLPVYYVEEGGEVKHYAMFTESDHIAAPLVFSNGDKLAYRNSSGEYQMGCFSDTTFQAMSAARDIFKGEYQYTFFVSGFRDFLQPYINEGAVLAMLPSAYVIGSDGSVCKGMDNFGVLPPPTGPSAPDRYVFSLHGQLEGSLAMSLFAKDIDATATILNAIYEPILNISTEEDMIQYLKRNYFFDDRDAELFFTMSRNSQFIHFGSTLYNTSICGYIGGTKTISEFMDSHKAEIQKAFEELVMPSVRGINAVWGDGAY